MGRISSAEDDELLTVRMRRAERDEWLVDRLTGSGDGADSSMVERLLRTDGEAGDE